MNNVTYWHGSSIELTTSDVLLPASHHEPGYLVLTAADLYGYDRDRVYVTTNRELARAWASRSSAGCLLRVEPQGELEADPDFPGISYSTNQATIVDVEEHPIKMSMLAARKAFAHTDIGRYDEKGYLNPSDTFLADLVAHGLTREMCRAFGRWANPHRIVLDTRTHDFIYLADDVDYAAAEALRSMLNHYRVEQVEDLPEPFRSHATSGQLHRSTAALVAERPIPWV